MSEPDEGRIALDCRRATERAWTRARGFAREGTDTRASVSVNDRALLSADATFRRRRVPPQGEPATLRYGSGEPAVTPTFTLRDLAAATCPKGIS